MSIKTEINNQQLIGIKAKTPTFLMIITNSVLFRHNIYFYLNLSQTVFIDLLQNMLTAVSGVHEI